MIDRLPEPGGDQRVIERIRQLQDEPGRFGLSGVTALRGNHEQILLDALDEPDPAGATGLWRCNGGDPSFLPVAREHQDWLAGLRYTAIRGRYLFVHAGVPPGLPLERQAKDDPLWIRRPFLDAVHHWLPYKVVHGHTFRRDYRITHLPHRIGIDARPPTMSRRLASRSRNRLAPRIISLCTRPRMWRTGRPAMLGSW